jgi:hypothetical protein
MRGLLLPASILLGVVNLGVGDARWHHWNGWTIALLALYSFGSVVCTAQ